jgi:hypothetical protein
MIRGDTEAAETEQRRQDSQRPLRAITPDH